MGSALASLNHPQATPRDCAVARGCRGRSILDDLTAAHQLCYALARRPNGLIATVHAGRVAMATWIPPSVFSARISVYCIALSPCV